MPAQYSFGSGSLIGTPLTSASGAIITNPSPVLFGGLQDCSIDISTDVKELFGQNQFPIAVGRGKAKITGKAKMAQINGMLFNELFFGQTLNSGVYTDYIDTTGTSVPSTPFTITPLTTYSSQLNGTTPVFGYDLGVRNALGVPMTRVASAPTTGQYSVTAGVYLFALADVGTTVFINFNYTATAAAGAAGQVNSIVSNVLMGQAPTFQTDFNTVYNGSSLTLTLYSCIATKLSFATKIDDFLIPEFDFAAFANSAGQVLRWQTTSQ